MKKILIDNLCCNWLNIFKRVPHRLKARIKINIIKCILEAQNEEGNFQQVQGADYYEYGTYSNQHGGYCTKPHRECTENRRPNNELSSSSFNLSAEEYIEGNFSNDQQSLVENSWDSLYNSENSMTDFIVKQIEHVFSFVHKYKYFLDFPSIESVQEIDEHLFGFWMGLKKPNSLIYWKNFPD